MLRATSVAADDLNRHLREYLLPQLLHELTIARFVDSRLPVRQSGATPLV
jgi:hypothetical protein